MAEHKTIHETIKSGAIMQSYGSKYLVTVSPAPSICKVKWSIVELNTGGKVYSNFFMDMELCRQLCDEIENGKASKKLAADMESQYPSAYKYVTGENGCKRLNIGGGQKGIRVQIQEKKGESWDNKMSVISPTDFLQMKFLFQLTMGLILTHKGSYYRNLYEEFWEGEEKRSEYFKKAYSENEDSSISEKETSSETSVTESKEEVVETKNIESESDYMEVTSLQIKVTDTLTDEKGGRAKLTGITREGKTVTVWFDTDVVNGATWPKVRTYGDRLGSTMTVAGFLKDNNFLAKEIAV